MPQRIQLRRTKGWRKPEGAVVVSRPSKWDNPFAVGEDVPDDLRCFLVHPLNPNGARLQRTLDSLATVHLLTAEQAVDAYGWWLFEQVDLMCSLDELAGRDLACWCPLGEPCHADVLLEMANR